MAWAYFSFHFFFNENKNKVIEVEKKNEELFLELCSAVKQLRGELTHTCSHTPLRHTHTRTNTYCHRAFVNGSYCMLSVYSLKRNCKETFSYVTNFLHDDWYVQWSKFIYKFNKSETFCSSRFLFILDVSFPSILNH